MTRANDYNGWENRETWLVNLYFGDTFSDMVREDIATYEDDLETLKRDEFASDYDRREYRGGVLTDIADRYKDFFDEMLNDEMNKLGNFLSDYINFGLINWYELAVTILVDMLSEYELQEA